MTTPPLTQLSPDRYRIGWICPLKEEQLAAIEMLDERHERLPQSPLDSNNYTLGRIAEHNIAIAGLPQSGSSSAATVVTQMRRTFEDIQYWMLVGIGGGVPTETDQGTIRLGHVVVSKPTGEHSGVIQYDHGKAMENCFERTGYLMPPPSGLLNAAQALDIHRESLEDGVSDPVWMNTQRFAKKRRLHKYLFPGFSKDHLYQPDHQHPIETSHNASKCGSGYLVERATDGESDDFVVVHRGNIASGEWVIKNAQLRDTFARQHNVLCFEMEAAGVLTDLPCLVIRGISDYCDSHKNDEWRCYAAAVAAAYARQLIFHIPTSLELNNSSPRVFSYQRPKTSNHLEAGPSPSSYFIPFPENRRFVGREKVTRELIDLLFNQNTPRVALFGLGGIGKTQTALKIAHFVKHEKLDHSVFWLPAISEASFDEACAHILTYLDFAGTKSGVFSNPGKSLAEYLKSPKSGKWFAVLDNADNEGLLMKSPGILDFLPVTQNGKLLITTRTRHIASFASDNNMFELRGMSSDESRDLLGRCLMPQRSVQNEDHILELLRLLEYFPLAITQAASYMNINAVSVEGYLERFRNAPTNIARLMQFKDPGFSLYEESQRSILTTWKISFDQISTENVGAARLLDFITWIEPKSIPLSLLPDLESEEVKDEAISILCRYGFLDRHERRGLFDMHSLVHLVMQTWANAQPLAHGSKSAVLERLAKLLPDNGWETREVWRPFMTHGLYHLNVQRGSATTLLCELYRGLWSCLRLECRDSEAFHIQKEYVKLLESTYPPGDKELLRMQRRLAISFGNQHQPNDAIRLLEQVSAEQRNLPTQDADRLETQHLLGCQYRNVGRKEEAIVLLKDVVAARQGLKNIDPSLVVCSRTHLANAYVQLGQREKTIVLLEQNEQAMRGQEPRVAEEHPEMMVSQHLLGKVYSDVGNSNRAIEVLGHVCSVRDRTLEWDHPNRRFSLNELARAYKQSGQKKKEIETREKCMQICERALSEGNQDRLWVGHHLASAYWDNGQCERGLKLLETVVEVRQRTLGPSDRSRKISEDMLRRFRELKDRDQDQI